jgi:hypothetical protein
MGLFGFGKKKQTETETEKVFKEMGYETNDGKAPERQTRAQAKVSVENAKVAQVKKDNLLERLGELRKKMYGNPNFDDYVTKLEDSIYKLKSMRDSNDVQAMSSVDSLMLAEIDAAIDDCNTGNIIAIDASIDNIDGYINDRYNGGVYYKDPQYCKFMVERNRLKKEMKRCENEFDTLEKRRVNLINAYNDPSRHLNKDTVGRELLSINEKKKQINESIERINGRFKVIDKSLHEIKDKLTIHGNDALIDLDNEMDSVIEAKRENEHDESAYDKYNEKLSESNRKVSASALGVNDQDYGASTTTQFDDDLFKI